MMSKAIKDYMVKSPHSIGEDISLSKAMEMMRENGIRHLPVQYGGKIRGVLSDRDVKLALTVYPAAKDLKAGDIMTEEPYAVSPDASMAEVLSQMAIHKYGCAIVKNEQGRAIGIFTATDAVRVLGEVFHEKATASHHFTESDRAGSCCGTEPSLKVTYFSRQNA